MKNYPNLLSAVMAIQSGGRPVYANPQAVSAALENLLVERGACTFSAAEMATAEKVLLAFNNYGLFGQ